MNTPRSLADFHREGFELGTKAARRYRDIFKCLDGLNTKSPYAKRRFEIDNQHSRRAWVEGFEKGFFAAQK